jgi:hypothetical protein
MAAGRWATVMGSRGDAKLARKLKCSSAKSHAARILRNNPAPQSLRSQD